MAKLLLILVILFTVALVCIAVFEKVIHPLLFKEELEEKLETATEEKIRRDVSKMADEILGDNNVNTKK